MMSRKYVIGEQVMHERRSENDRYMRFSREFTKNGDGKHWCVEAIGTRNWRLAPWYEDASGELVPHFGEVRWFPVTNRGGVISCSQEYEMMPTKTWEEAEAVVAAFGV